MADFLGIEERVRSFGIKGDRLLVAKFALVYVVREETDVTYSFGDDAVVVRELANDSKGAKDFGGLKINTDRRAATFYNILNLYRLDRGFAVEHTAIPPLAPPEEAALDDLIALYNPQPTR